MWGLSPYDDNEQINTYKQNYGVTNPCAGTEGGGPVAIERVIDGQTFYGYPTYCVVCPDKKLHFNVCFPPTVECFDSFIAGCMETSVDQEPAAGSLMHIYPNPAEEWITVSSQLQGQVKLEIVDLLGIVNYHQVIASSGDINQAVDVSRLSPGFYFVTITKNDQRIVEKLRIR